MGLGCILQGLGILPRIHVVEPNVDFKTYGLYGLIPCGVFLPTSPVPAPAVTGPDTGVSKGNSRTSKLRERKIMEPLEDPLPLGLSVCSSDFYF
ncbi:hypothetical protein M0802_012327 [Mischocyttarus mexicanus]|nr:hypothetical protein M0802_012327 [Mischocyttarus mexicanus]